MFKGSTTAELNESTMILALQEYLAARAKDGFVPIVKSVKAASKGGYGGDSFTVVLDEPTEPAAVTRIAA